MTIGTTDQQPYDTTGIDSALSDASGDEANPGHAAGSSARPHGHRRAQHNATERQRREALNVRFQELASCVPALRGDKKPSKAQIVARSLDYVQFLAARSDKWAQIIQDLVAENDLLRASVNQLRTQQGLPPVSERTLTASDLLRDDELLEAYDILPKPQAVPVTHAGMLAGHPGLMAAFNIGSTSGASGTTMPGGAVRTRRVSETAMLNAAAGRQMRPPALAPPSASPRFLGQSPLQQSMTVDPTSAESGTTDMSMETSGLPIVDTLAYGGMLGLPSVGQPLARSCPSGRGSSFTDMDNYFFDETQDQMLNLNLQAAVQQLTDSYNAQAASNGAAQYDGAAPLFRSTGFEVAPASGNDGDPTLGTMDDRSTNVQLDHDRDDTWMMAAAMAQATSKLKKEGAGNGANSMEMDNNQWLVTGDDADDGEALMNDLVQFDE